MHTVRHDNIRSRVPAGPIDDEGDPPVRPSADLRREFLQRRAHARGGDRAGDQPLRAARRGVDEAPHVSPLVATLAAPHRPPPAGAPGPSRGWKQADPRLVLAPDLYAGSRMTTRNLLDRFFEPPFLKASTAS